MSRFGRRNLSRGRASTTIVHPLPERAVVRVEDPNKPGNFFTAIILGATSSVEVEEPKSYTYVVQVESEELKNTEESVIFAESKDVKEVLSYPEPLNTYLVQAFRGSPNCIGNVFVDATSEEEAREKTRKRFPKGTLEAVRIK